MTMRTATKWPVQPAICRFCEHPRRQGDKNSDYCPACRWKHCRVVFCACGRGESQCQLTFPLAS